MVFQTVLNEELLGTWQFAWIRKNPYNFVNRIKFSKTHRWRCNCQKLKLGSVKGYNKWKKENKSKITKTCKWRILCIPVRNWLWSVAEHTVSRFHFVTEHCGHWTEYCTFLESVTGACILNPRHYSFSSRLESPLFDEWSAIYLYSF